MKKSVIIGCVLLLVHASCTQPKKEVTSPIMSPITEAVFATGHLEAEGQLTLNALADASITEILVQEGDIVAREQVLVRQDNTPAKIQLETASEILVISEQQASSQSPVLQQQELQLKNAIEKLKKDKEQAERLKRLLETQSVARIDVENAELAYENSVNTVNSLEQNIIATRQNLTQTLANNRGQKKTAQTNTDYHLIKSPGNFKVYSLLKETGELARKGEALVVLGHPSQARILLNIDESSISKIKPGQQVLVELNTEKGKIYTGHIEKIHPSFDEINQAYLAEAVFDQAPETFITGTLIQANIIINSRDKALLIPRSCLTPAGQVVLKKGNRSDTISIKTGIVANDWVEVISGIDPNDKIYKQ